MGQLQDRQPCGGWQRGARAAALGIVIVAGCTEEPSRLLTVTRPRLTVSGVTSVTMSPTSPTVLVGDSVKFSSAGYDSTGAMVTTDCGWSSGDTSIAKIDWFGMAHGRKAGGTSIRTKCGGVADSTSITVSALTAPATATATVTVTPATASLAVGGTVQLTAVARDSSGNILSGKTFTWSSSAPSVASVSAGGVVTGLSPGAATISASVDGKTGSAAVSVTQPTTTWPNDEPSGLTTLLRGDGSSAYYFAPRSNVVIGGKWSDPTIYPAANNGTRVQVVADPASKYGEAVQKWTFTGETSGFNGFYSLQGTPGFGDGNGYRELYIRMVFEFSSNWQWEVAHTQKLLYFATNRTNQAGGGNPTSFFVSVDKGQIDFVDQGNPVSANIYGNGDGTAYNIDYRYIPPAGLISAGKYITVELWIHANSSPTTADGQARLWVNGSEISASMTALMGVYKGQKGLANRIWCGDTKFFGTGTGFNANFNDAETLLYWGGSGDTAATNFYFNLSELYVSGILG